MPQQQGEVSLLTLFADVHYYMGPPTAKPPHHRFDKTSYVYLYHSPIQSRGRIEIANHAGTPEQDAFAGNLDTVRVEQTYKHPCLFTITADAYRSQNGSAHSTPQQDMSQWHLPAYDPQSTGKYMYKLHTLDIYFWTVEDANLFLDSLKRVLQPHQLQITADPSPKHAEHRSDVMSPVVEKLEQAAISKPYRNPSISTTQSFQGPPTTAAAPASPPATEAQGNYAPLAYNPAAPAAPEPIAHREKTPPPPDAADGTGLGTAAMHDHAAQYGTHPTQSSFTPQATGSQPYMPGPPSRQPTQTFSGPPTPGIQRMNTSGSFPPPPPPQSSSTGSQYGQGFSPPPQASTAPTATQYANYPGSPGFPPMQSPGLPGTPGHPPYSPGFPSQQSGYQPVSSPGLTPSGGYSQYGYGQPTDAYNVHGVHHQLYKPTEQEVKAHGKIPTAQPNQQPPGRFEQRADKIEKGVGKFLKKLDKKF